MWWKMATDCNSVLVPGMYVMQTPKENTMEGPESTYHDFVESA